MFMLLQDGNGFINRMELRHVMMNLGEKMSEEECDALVDVRPHLSNFKVKLCRRKSKHNGGTFGSGKNRSNVTKLEKINTETTALLTECGQTIFGFTRVIRVLLIISNPLFSFYSSAYHLFSHPRRQTSTAMAASTMRNFME